MNHEYKEDKNIPSYCEDCGYNVEDPIHTVTLEEREIIVCPCTCEHCIYRGPHELCVHAAPASEEKEWNCICGMTMPRFATHTVDGYLRCQECKRVWDLSGKEVMEPSPASNGIEEVIAEFEKKFITDDGDYSYRANDVEATTVKSFIRTKLHAVADKAQQSGYEEGLKAGSKNI